MKKTKAKNRPIVRAVSTMVAPFSGSDAEEGAIGPGGIGSVLGFK